MRGNECHKFEFNESIRISEQLKQDPALIDASIERVVVQKVVRFGNFILYFLKFCSLKSFWS